MYKINFPTDDEGLIRTLNIMDEIEISGRVITARDEGHKFLVAGLNGELEGEDLKTFEALREELRGSMIYHAGPVTKEEDGEYEIIALGPTTSIREEPYTARIIQELGIRAVAGKGGMGADSSVAFKEHGAVYVQLCGGAGALLADRIVAVKGVYMLEKFGAAEAFWLLEIDKLPGIVSMDSHDRSLHENVRDRAYENYKNLCGV